MRPHRDSVPAALAWRYLCHSAMLLLSLLGEGRPAPSLPDTVLAQVPRLPWLDVWNYWIWLACYLPPALLLWRRDRGAFLRFLYLGGWLSLARGVCVLLTGLGPVHGPDVNAGLQAQLHGAALLRAWLTLVNPFSTLFGGAAGVYLTKDLFFSGHASTTFLLWLYCRGRRPLGALALACHLLVVAVVFLTHLHYTIDVVGAWAITFSAYALAEGWPAPRQPAGATPA